MVNRRKFSADDVVSAVPVLGNDHNWEDILDPGKSEEALAASLTELVS